MKGISAILGGFTLGAGFVTAETIAQINGIRFLSPYNGKAVTNLTGIVTAKGPDGIWLHSIKPSPDVRVSDGIYVFGSALAKNTSIAAGDVIVIDGKVQEYRSNKDYLYMTEISSPVVRAILDHGRTIEPLLLGSTESLTPPTEQFSSLDTDGDVFAVPNNVSLVSVADPILEPATYGLDFWESLVGQLVKIEKPRAVGRPNQYGDTWVVGTWATTGDNDRTGLTVSPKDGNPEAIIIGTPLDGSANSPDGRLGDQLEDIVGVVYQAFGFYRILPLTNLTVIESLAPQVAGPTTLTSDGICSGITIGGYNVENLFPGDTSHITAVATHFVNVLKTPDLIAVQEVQDNNGETNDGTVDSADTLRALVSAVANLTDGVVYNYTYINPVDKADGGAPGGNIRVAYMYRPEVLQLKSSVGGTGNTTIANEVLPGPELKYNPGLIDPSNPAWSNSRKPLAAAWELVNGEGSTLFTVNVHWGSKGGSTTLHGDARPPVNGGVDNRQAQSEVTAAFISSLLTADPDAYIISVGDFNEFSFVKPIVDFMSLSGGMQDLDVVADIEPTERYTYLFDSNSQELDHMFASPALARNMLGFEHLHVNTWLPYDDKTSDHDPTVGKFDIC